MSCLGCDGLSDASYVLDCRFGGDGTEHMHFVLPRRLSPQMNV